MKEALINAAPGSAHKKIYRSPTFSLRRLVNAFETWDFKNVKSLSTVELRDDRYPHTPNPVMQRTLSKTDMQTHIDRLTNYSTNISSQKVFFAKLKDKYHTFNEMQSPQDYEDEED